MPRVLFIRPLPRRRGGQPQTAPQTAREARSPACRPEPPAPLKNPRRKKPRRRGLTAAPKSPTMFFMEPEGQTSREQIARLVSENPVMLFMKGEPGQPRCGFSARVVQILDFLKVQYKSFDVLSDESIRQGVKDYGSWPTIPQLYVNKELLGGCDIVQEQFETGELEKTLASFVKKSGQSLLKN